MNLNNFTTPEEIFSLFHFEKWKKMKQLFSFRSKSMPYSARESLDAIKVGSIILGSIALFVELIMCIAQQKFVGMSALVAGIFYLPAIYMYSFPYTEKIGLYLVHKFYGGRFKKHMTESRLKNFITILSSHQYAPHYMKNLSHYDNLILAFHHNSKDFIYIGFDLMNTFYINFSEKSREHKNKNILENFHKKPSIDFTKSEINHSKKEDKFLFM